MLPENENQTKAQNLQTIITSNILHGIYKIGSKLPSEREMAENYSVSRDTVRQVYTNLENAGILKRQQGSGTHINPTFQGNTKKATAVALICSEADIFGMEFILAMEQALAKRDTMMIFKMSQNPATEETLMLELMKKGINNIIIWPSGHNDLHTACKRLRALGANIVIFDKIKPRKYADYIGLDHEDAIEKLLEHARINGAKIFSHISLADQQNIHSVKSRVDAFINWCEEKQLPYDIHYISLKDSELQKKFETIIKTCQKDSKPRAYICVNDISALKLKEVHENLELVYGIDGIASPVCDGIITFIQPLEKMANKAVDLIFDQQRLGNKWKAKQIIMKGDLIDKY